MDPILDDIEDFKSTPRYVAASRGARFANYIIDSIGFYAICFLIAMVILSTVDFENPTFYEEESYGTGGWADTIVFILIYVFYYVAMEYFLRGKTLGKLITRTRAVTDSNKKMDFGTVVKRNFCRIIPFDNLSFFGERGWHDNISKTRVIKDEHWSAS